MNPERSGHRGYEKVTSWHADSTSRHALSIGDYFASRVPVSGTVYIVMLGVFAIMPLVVARR